jgi:hypothetical protein
MDMGVILMRPLASGVFQRLMSEAWAAVPAAIEIDTVSRDGAECRGPHINESACAHGSIVGRELVGLIIRTMSSHVKSVS